MELLKNDIISHFYCKIWKRSSGQVGYVILEHIIYSFTNLSHGNTSVLLSDEHQNLGRDSAWLGLQSVNFTNELLTIESITLDSSINEEIICNRLFDSNPPLTTFLMDISQNSSLGKHLARKMGIATLRSTSFSKSYRDNAGWKNLNENERGFLISVLTPEAVIMHMIKDISSQFGYKSIVIIYDHTFSEYIL